MDVKPTALLLESGDIVIMSKESRLNYHGVPKVMPTDYCPWNFSNDCDVSENACIPDVFDKQTWKNCMCELEWKPFSSYCKGSRININVRQVLNKGQHTFIG